MFRVEKEQFPDTNFMTHPITNLTALYNNDNTITLIWNGIAAFYDIYISTNYSAGFNLSANTSNNNWTYENASSYKERHYKVGVRGGVASEETVGKFDIELYSGLTFLR